MKAEEESNGWQRKNQSNHADRFLWDYYGQWLFWNRYGRWYRIFWYVLQIRSRWRRICRNGRRRADDRLSGQPEVYRQRHRLFKKQGDVLWGIPWISQKLQILLWRMGSSRRHADIPAGAYSYSKRPYHSGAVCRINDSPSYKSSEPYCN